LKFDEIDQEPIVMTSIAQIEAGITACSELMRKLRETLRQVMESCGSTKQLLVVINTFAKTTDGKMTLLGCQRHKGFTYDQPCSMSNLKNLLAIDRGVKKEQDFHKVFSAAFGSNKTVHRKSMDIIKKVTGDAMDQESMASRTNDVPQHFAAALAHTKTTTLAFYTPVWLGNSAAKMDGTVFHLQTIVDNGQPGLTCRNTNTVTSNIKANTLLRILIDQEGQIDMWCHEKLCGQLHQSPPSPVPGDLGRCPSHQSHASRT